MHAYIGVEHISNVRIILFLLDQCSLLVTFGKCWQKLNIDGNHLPGKDLRFVFADVSRPLVRFTLVLTILIWFLFKFYGFLSDMFSMHISVCIFHGNEDFDENKSSIYGSALWTSLSEICERENYFPTLNSLMQKSRENVFDCLFAAILFFSVLFVKGTKLKNSRKCN